VEVTAEHGFCVWVVIKLTAHTANQVLLGLAGSNDHWLEFKAGADVVRCFVGSGTATSISPGDGSLNHLEAGTKMVVTLQREAGGTGNFNIWKNGVLLAQDSQAANTGEGTFNAIGQRGTTRYLNSTIYDLAMTDSHTTSIEHIHIDRVNAHLCAKHGISQTL